MSKVAAGSVSEYAHKSARWEEVATSCRIAFDIIQENVLQHHLAKHDEEVRAKAKHVATALCDLMVEAERRLT